MNPEKNDKKLTRWLLIATIALLVLVLGLQLWQLFGKKAGGNSGAPLPNSTGSPAGLRDPAVSPGRTAMIEDVRALNPALSFDDLAALSAGELEQLYETGAPGLPIGVSAAAQAAEEYAGTLEVDSVTSETDPELDEAPPYYEVELHHPTLGDFTYKIDAYTGAVLEGTSNIMGLTRDASAPQTPAPETAAPETAAPGGEEAAKNAAFAHAGISAADASSVRCELERDDGRQVYDIEFRVGGTEYDYRIDAATNAVLKAEQELNGHHAETAPRQDGGLIGDEAARSAALAHAGLSAADAGYIACELDQEDGRWIYELSFRAGGVEYDYEIDAASGTVLKAELDR